MLEPAAKMGGFECVWEPDEALFAITDGDDLLAVATAWMSIEKYVEVKLVGGRDFRRWLADLNTEIGARARAAGATRLTANGRAGWAKSLKALGWDRLGEVDGMTVYSREL